MSLTFRLAAAATAVTAVAAIATPAHAGHREGLRRVSTGASGQQADVRSFGVSVSADGRLVAFTSSATNLVPGDTNSREDVFVHDTRWRRTVRVSVGDSGDQAQGYDSRAAAISANGRYVTFASRAANLVPGDTNGATDVFVRDLLKRRTRRVSVTSDGREAAGGRGRAAGQPSISADGRHIAFLATFPDLIPGDTNDAADIFVHDRASGRTRRVSVATGGGQATGISVTPSISADGRHVAFTSSAADLVRGDTNEATDIFVHDVRRGRTERASLPARGGQAAGNSTHPAVSASGRYVSFTSGAANLVPGDTNETYDVFVRDLRRRRTERVSVDGKGRQGDAASGASTINGNGRYVALTSSATLVPGDSNGMADVFLHDRRRGTTVRLNVGPGGRQANAQDLSASVALSHDGHAAAFESPASSLADGDTNGVGDVFTWQRRGH